MPLGVRGVCVMLFGEKGHAITGEWSCYWEGGGTGQVIWGKGHAIKGERSC